MKDNQAKYPQLRFKGFTNPWEQRKLGDIVVFLNGRAYKQAELLDSGKYPVLRVGNFNTNDKWYYSDLELPAKNYADKGDLLYTWATAFGPHIWKGPKVIYHYHIWKVETTSNISKNFAVHLLDADQAQMTNSLNGSTMVHITKGTMENKIVTIPGISEQRNMARLLDQLDCTIALHQRKLAKLKELKQGYLQKLFPKNGSKFPQLRFAGFADAWEQRKLGEHADILTGGTPKTSMSNYWEPKEIPWMSSGEVNKKRLDKTDNMISTEGLENSSARWVKEHSIMIALAGQGKTRGTVAINNIPLTTNQSIAAIEPDETLNYEFVFQNLSKRYDELRIISSGDGTRGGLNKQIVSDVIISAPSIEEQQKIGTLFQQFDTLITLHQRKLEKLQELKKGYLQKMFC
ncbi:restriction endonuclease subunit S [Lactiplantibacillus paraplantarum]|uniref:restriction endonuclease subunit S n=1 Tax=Lactiplantibacillus paraplantarum TaxID=60520 RepID=UPI002222F332|nr:restriction endonuclease subunit S [Lactiplantibacillus paraplantarum]MCW1911746.1 restriction endonuclease subunit S [Lactiplantibacillus paraplantarum]